MFYRKELKVFLSKWLIAYFSYVYLGRSQSYDEMAARYRRHNNALLKQKEEDLAALLKEHKSNLHLDLRDRIETTRLELNIFLTMKAEKQCDGLGQIFTTKLINRVKFYRQGWPQDAPPDLPKIRKLDGSSTQNPKSVLK